MTIAALFLALLATARDGAPGLTDRVRFPNRPAR